MARLRHDRPRRRQARSPFAVRLRELRNAKGWPQERLAEEAGIHRTYIGGIETARRNPSLRNIIRMARALGVPVAELFSGM